LGAQSQVAMELEKLSEMNPWKYCVSSAFIAGSLKRHDEGREQRRKRGRCKLPEKTRNPQREGGARVEREGSANLAGVIGRTKQQLPCYFDQTNR